RQSHELGHNGAGPGPRLDRFFGAGLLRSLHLLEHLKVHKRTFFARSTHRMSFVGQTVLSAIESGRPECPSRLLTAVSFVLAAATGDGGRSLVSRPSRVGGCGRPWPAHLSG